jgi:ribonuclease HI
MEDVLVYTDGGYSMSKNKGGYGVVVVFNGEVEKTVSKEIFYETSQRAELLALIEGLNQGLRFCDFGYKVVLRTDSRYCYMGYNNWLKSWKKKNYQGRKNQDLWEKIDLLRSELLKVEWVRGHNGDVYNELADELATYD